jgi:hypothetical protein
MAIKYLDAKRLQGTNAERLALTTGLPDYEENFDTDPTSGDWTLTGSSVSYDSTDKNISIVPADSASDFYGLVIDLQDVLGSNLNNSTWVMQFTWKADSYTANTTGSHCDCGVFLESLDPASGDTETNWGFKFGGGGTGGSTYLNDYCISGIYQNSWQAFRQPSQNVAGRAEWVDFGVTPSTGTTVGIRLTRESTTAFKGELFSDADFDSTPTSISLTDTTMMGNIDDQRYLLIAGYRDVGFNGANNNSFDNLKIWNGVTSVPATVYPNLPNGTIFNETDTYKYFMFDGTDTWNQMVSS